VDSGDWTVIAVGIALAGICITLAAFILNTVRDIRADIRALSDRLDKRIDEQDAKLETLSARLGRLEQAQAHTAGMLETLPERLGRLEQEQARMNGVLETVRAGLSYRVERADAGDRVAEDAESYEPER
jgi:septal ring factor EnvC (AmiA/AmiB activator)